MRRDGRPSAVAVASDTALGSDGSLPSASLIHSANLSMGFSDASSETCGSLRSDCVNLRFQSSEVTADTNVSTRDLQKYDHTVIPEKTGLFQRRSPNSRADRIVFGSYCDSDKIHESALPL